MASDEPPQKKLCNRDEESDALAKPRDPAAAAAAAAAAPACAPQAAQDGSRCDAGQPDLSADAANGAKPDDAPVLDAAAAIAKKGAEGRVRWMTSKQNFRARAHSNPLNDGLFHPPANPTELPLARWYGEPTPGGVQWCDIGCGYGGLLACLSAAYPDVTMLGLEIRDRVAEFCRRRVLELRREHAGEYGNVFFERTNAMKYLPHYFAKGSLQKLFFCYPDPHFKRKKNRQRIISPQLLDEYAFVLREREGVAYVVTDVDELFDWMVARFEKHPLFERRAEPEHRADAVTGFLRDMTDEAQRVEKSDRRKQDASFRRVANP